MDKPNMVPSTDELLAVRNKSSRRKTLTELVTAPGSNLSDSINLGILQHLETAFLSADADGSGQLSMDEFVAAFKGLITTADGSDEAALRRLFMCVDGNCDGAVDWNEFSAYLLMEKTGGTTSPAVPATGHSTGGSPAFHALECQVLPAGIAHRELISSVLHVDTGNGPDRWYSAGKDGVVKVWNGKDLTYLRTLQTPLQTVVSATFMPGSELLALGGYSSTVMLLDPASADQAGKLCDAASSAAISLCSWQEGRLGVGPTGKELVAVGDGDGRVNLVEVESDDTVDAKSSQRYRGRHLWRSANHHDWVVAVLHLPQLNSLLAASLDKNLTMTDVERCIAMKQLQGHDKAVTCCAWSSCYKMVASGGEDCKLLLWNPFSCRSLGTLAGHAAALVSVTVNDRDHQVISADTNKTIKVWDLRNQRCLQTITDSSRRPAADPFVAAPAAIARTSSRRASDTISSLVYCPQRRLLVSAGCELKGWTLISAQSKGAAGHKDAISCVLCHSMFCEAVSTDHAGTVCVWDIPSGRLRLSFSKTHGDASISAAAFDVNQRRLITGAEDGTIKAWNFSSGVLLSTLATTSAHSVPGNAGGGGCQVTGIAVSNSNQSERTIVATGWDKKVSWYDDCGQRRCNLLRSAGGPTSDVLSAAMMPGRPTLATSCYNGEIWVWNLESGAVQHKLLPKGHSSLPENEQAVERVSFLTGVLRHVLLAIGADRYMRFWDSYSGTLLLEHFTGHSLGSSIAAAALSSDNKMLATADTAGFIMVWDISRLASFFLGSSRIDSKRQSGVASCVQPALPASPAAEANASTASLALGVPRRAGQATLHCPRSACSGELIQRIACWRGHQECVTALDWVVPPTPAAAAAARRSMEQLMLEENRLPVQQATECASLALPVVDGTTTCLATAQHLPDAAAAAVMPAGGAEQADVHQPRDAISQHQLGFFISASVDKSLCLWSTAGGLVGTFGRHDWNMEKLDSWQNIIKPSLTADEEFDMLVSSRIMQLTTEADEAAGSTLEAGKQQPGPPQHPHHCPTPPALCRRPAMVRVSAVEQQQSQQVLSPGIRPQSARKLDSLRSEPSSCGNNPRAASVVGRQSCNTPEIEHTGAQCDSCSSSSVASSGANPQHRQIWEHSGATGAASGTTTPRSIALVCQASLRQRQHSLHTLSSFTRGYNVGITSAEHPQEAEPNRKCWNLSGNRAGDTTKDTCLDNPGETPSCRSSIINGGKGLASASKPAEVSQFGFAAPGIRLQQDGIFASASCEAGASAGDWSNDLEANIPSTLWLPGFGNSGGNSRPVSAARKQPGAVRHGPGGILRHR